MKTLVSPASTTPAVLWMVRAEGARVVALSSYRHRRAGVDFHDPNFERREYDPWIAYGQSKTTNSLFAVALDSIGKRRGVLAFAWHPRRCDRIAPHLSKAQIEDTKIIDQPGKPMIDPEDNKKTARGSYHSLVCNKP